MPLGTRSPTYALGNLSGGGVAHSPVLHLRADIVCYVQAMDEQTQGRIYEAGMILAGLRRILREQQEKDDRGLTSSEWISINQAIEAAGFKDDPYGWSGASAGEWYGALKSALHLH